MWYLQHEVMWQKPPKFGIERILRYKISTKAPQALIDKCMNFGVRYAYDSQNCTGPGDCVTMYDRYGYFVGCNNFKSNYPYPDEPTSYPTGIWYSLPGEGACDGSELTGASDCTYTYSWPPEEISLKELAAPAGGQDAFWEAGDVKASEKKVKAAAGLFKKNYPKSPDLTTPPCDFDFSKFWS